MCTLPWRPGLLLVSSSIIFHLRTEEGSLSWALSCGVQLVGPVRVLSSCFCLPEFWDYRVATPTCPSMCIEDLNSQ